MRQWNFIYIHIRSIDHIFRTGSNVVKGYAHFLQAVDRLSRVAVIVDLKPFK